MKMRINGANYATPAARETLAKFLAGTIEGGTSRFEPYKMNAFSDTVWVFDAANSWWLTFFDDDPSAFDIAYRYQSLALDAEGALSGWLEFRVDAVQVPATAEPRSDGAPIQIDRARMDAALASKSVTIPAGLGREQTRAFIASHGGQ